MAEVMTVESILEAYWLLEGFWVKPRFPFQTRKGAWSDIDALAYDPERQWLVIGESKVRGPKDVIYAHTRETEKKYGDILKYDDDNYFGFLEQVGVVCADGVVFADFRKMVKKLTIHLVSNYYIADEMNHATVSTVIARVRAAVPAEVELAVRLESTFDVMCSIIEQEHRRGQGKRYGHPVIDLAREFNRYLHPQILYAGKDRQALEAIRRAQVDKLLTALQVNSAVSG